MSLKKQKRSEESKQQSTPVDESPSTPEVRQPKVEQIPLDQIFHDPRLKMRELDPKVVEKYATLLKQGAKLPPIHIFRIDGKLVPADGGHREEARRRNEETTIDAIVHDGTIADAMLLALTNNTTHGHPLTEAEQRDAIKKLLKQKIWWERSDQEIHRKLGMCVSARTVGRYRQEIKKAGEAPVEDTGVRKVIKADGTESHMKTKNIGGKPKTPAAASPAPVKAAQGCPPALVSRQQPVEAVPPSVKTLDVLAEEAAEETPEPTKDVGQDIAGLDRQVNNCYDMAIALVKNRLPEIRGMHRTNVIAIIRQFRNMGDYLEKSLAKAPHTADEADKALLSKAA